LELLKRARHKVQIYQRLVMLAQRFENAVPAMGWKGGGCRRRNQPDRRTLQFAREAGVDMEVPTSEPT